MIYERYILIIIYIYIYIRLYICYIALCVLILAILFPPKHTAKVYSNLKIYKHIENH